MDLTSLSSNLPRNPPPAAAAADEHAGSDAPYAEPTAGLLAAFRQAALSVTTLYKAAEQEVDRARRESLREGYAECLDDVLLMLAKIETRADADARSLEIIRQWALSKRRKFPGDRPRRKREDREASLDSERRSTSPVLSQQQRQASNPPQLSPSSPPTRRSSPRAAPPPPQVPVIFQQSRPVPPPLDTVDVELPDHENDSPPTSPKRTPQFGSQNIFQFQANTHPSTPVKSHGKRRDPRLSNKRGFDAFNVGNMNDFFDLAGIEKLHQAKRNRYQ